VRAATRERVQGLNNKTREQAVATDYERGLGVFAQPPGTQEVRSHSRLLHEPREDLFDQQPACELTTLHCRIRTRPDLEQSVEPCGIEAPLIEGLGVAVVVAPPVHQLEARVSNAGRDSATDVSE
jgi:hypothetical protein